MSWRSDSIATKVFHTKLQSELGIAEAGRPKIAGKQGWGIRDTARELKLSVRHVVEDLKLAEIANSIDYARLERKEALMKLEGKSIVPLDKLLINHVTAALAWLIEPVDKKKSDQVRIILRKALNEYNDRKGIGRPEKNS